MELKVFQTLEYINNRLANIEKNILRIDEKLDFSIALQRNHLIRVKNGEELDNSMILTGRPYNDLSPAQAYDVFQNKNMEFIMLDVSQEDYSPQEKLPGTIKIPLENLNTRYSDIQSKTTPILVISEVGLRSIQACELLIKKGFFNLNNVSGGYKFWKGFKSQEDGALPPI